MCGAISGCVESAALRQQAHLLFGAGIGRDEWPHIPSSSSSPVLTRLPSCFLPLSLAGPVRSRSECGWDEVLKGRCCSRAPVSWHGPPRPDDGVCLAISQALLWLPPHLLPLRLAADRQWKVRAGQWRGERCGEAFSSVVETRCR